MLERICATCQWGNCDPLPACTPETRGHCTANFESVSAYDTCPDWEVRRPFTQAEIKGEKEI